MPSLAPRITEQLSIKDLAGIHQVCDCSLKDHTQEFLYLAYYTHFPDNTFITFYCSGLNEHLKTQLLSGGLYICVYKLTDTLCRTQACSLLSTFTCALFPHLRSLTFPELLRHLLRHQHNLHGPQGTFCECVECAILLSGSPFIVGEVEEDPTGTTIESPKHFFVGRALCLKLLRPQSLIFHGSHQPWSP